MYGLDSQTHYELEHLIDLSTFDNIKLDIIKGIVTAKPLAKQGMGNNPISTDDMSYQYPVEPLFTSFQKYKSLDPSDPIKVAGEDLLNTHGKNALFMFVKYVYGSHDLLSLYNFWDDPAGWKTKPKERNLSDVAEHFPSLIAWIDSLVEQKVFSYISRAYLISHESGAISFEHRDPANDPESPDISEFIHIRPDLKRPFYVYDPEAKQKHYVQTRVAWFNDRDVHGGDTIGEPTFAIRIDGLFTEEFKQKIKQ
jgi:hypothetical protein